MSAAAGAPELPFAGWEGIDARRAARLAKLGIRKIEDLLFHLPLRYEDRSRILPLGRVRPGQSVLVTGVVELAEMAPGGRRGRLLCRISDGTGCLTLQFFNFYPSQRKRLHPGVRLQCYGEVRVGAVGPQMIHPQWRVLAPGDPVCAEEGLTPVYPATEGLNQASLRRLIGGALKELMAGRAGAELLPQRLREELGLPTLLEALRLLHAPSPFAAVTEIMARRHPAVRRIVLEELLAHRLSLLRLRSQQLAKPAPRLLGAGELLQACLARLPFQLTPAQVRVMREVAGDMTQARPMLRLVQGDVGCGKTVIAALAALTAVEAGWQVAFMAPTELLAEQHYRNFQRWLTPLGVESTWFTSRLTSTSRDEHIRRLANGEIRVAVGTHALFQARVDFPRLGLAIVDEQHRFGVHQRLALKNKSGAQDVQPHQLIMTATPIPRTLAMTAYADLDVSVIDELPPGRKPITTVVIPDSRRGQVIERIRHACAEGRQAYWVCTLVGESEAIQAQAAEVTAKRLQESLPELSVGLVHGRMKGAQKELVMAGFESGQVQLLVATTVIEVGVDVPNASLMIIENAERLGLAQLHQLRGRIGRGEAASSCVLMYHGRLSRSARARLGILRQTRDGFRIAQCDLELRGPGELLGIRQTGELQYRVADLARDADLLADVQRWAALLLQDYPDRVDALIARWIGEGERYAQV